MRPATCIVLACALIARPATGAALADFARCLKRAGATFYTAAWCPHCAEQTEMFGDAVRWLHVVDCTDGCSGVASFPTWRFRDGSELHGVATLEALGARTGCRVGGAGAVDDDAVEAWTGPGTTAR